MLFLIDNPPLYCCGFDRWPQVSRPICPAPTSSKTWKYNLDSDQNPGPFKCMSGNMWLCHLVSVVDCISKIKTSGAGVFYCLSLSLPGIFLNIFMLQFPCGKGVSALISGSSWVDLHVFLPMFFLHLVTPTGASCHYAKQANKTIQPMMMIIIIILFQLFYWHFCIHTGNQLIIKMVHSAL